MCNSLLSEQEWFSLPVERLGSSRKARIKFLAKQGPAVMPVVRSAIHHLGLLLLPIILVNWAVVLGTTDSASFTLENQALVDVDVFWLDERSLHWDLLAHVPQGRLGRINTFEVSSGPFGSFVNDDRRHIYRVFVVDPLPLILFVTLLCCLIGPQVPYC